MNPILIGGIAGAGAGGVLLFLSHVAPRFGAGNFIRDLDEIRVLGRAVTHREAHILGMFIHVVLSFCFGVLFAYFVASGVVQGYTLIPLLLYAALMTVVMGGVVMPLEGHGVFGRKEDAWFPIDLMITNLLWVFLYWCIIRLWLPSI
jgi:uncharacterized membrane protein (DUF2068 family)